MAGLESPRRIGQHSAVWRTIAWPLSYFAAHPAYLRLWLLSVGAGMLASAVRVAIIVSIVDPSAFVLTPAYFVLLEGVAAFVLAPFGGALIDRTSPGLILAIVEAARAAVLLTFVLVPIPAVLFLLVLAWAGLGGLHQAARDAFVLDAVPRDKVAGASGLDQTAAAVSLILGPILGAILALQVDLRVTLAILAALHLATLALANGLRKSQVAKPQLAPSGWPLSVPRRSLDRIGVLVLVTFFAGAAIGAIWLAVAPAIIASGLNASPAWLGFQMTLAGIACILGGLCAPGALQRYGHLRVLSAMAFAESASFALYSLTPSLLVSNVAIALIGLFAGGVGAAFYACVQNVTDAAERGRVFAMIRQVDAAAILLAGALAATLPRVPGWSLLCVAAIAYAGCAMAVARLRVPKAVVCGEPST